MTNHCLQWIHRDETEISRTRCRMCGFVVEFMATLVQIHLLLTKMKGHTIQGNHGLRPHGLRIERAVKPISATVRTR
jgi:hypothetical protein